jgi:hypothetical protein
MRIVSAGKTVHDTVTIDGLVHHLSRQMDVPGGARIALLDTEYVLTRDRLEAALVRMAVYVEMAFVHIRVDVEPMESLTAALEPLSPPHSLSVRNPNLRFGLVFSRAVIPGTDRC